MAPEKQKQGATAVGSGDLLGSMVISQTFVRIKCKVSPPAQVMGVPHGASVPRKKVQPSVFISAIEVFKPGRKKRTIVSTVLLWASVLVCLSQGHLVTVQGNEQQGLWSLSFGGLGKPISHSQPSGKISAASFNRDDN
jgi:hypothetical protein